jgi:hypothetical protein
VSAEHKHIRPRSVTNPEVLEGYAGEYLYLGGIAFINQVRGPRGGGALWSLRAPTHHHPPTQVKSGAPFAEHSPVLAGIAEVPTWGKVHDGLLRMYKGEVLAKLPVVQVREATPAAPICPLIKEGGGAALPTATPFAPSGRNGTPGWHACAGKR